MTGVFLLIAGVVGFGIYLFVGPVVIDTYRRYRDGRTIICPETDQIVEMEFKAGRAGILAALGKHELRVKWCSLWTHRKGCTEDCTKGDWPQRRDRASSEPRQASIKP